MDHNKECKVTNKILSKGIHIIQENQFLIDLIKTTNYGTDQKKEHDCQMLLSTIGVYDFNIASRTLNRANTNLRTKFVKEFVNYYNMVVGYLKVYVQIHPSALAVVQSDTNGCFYRLMVSIPNTKTLFEMTCIPIYFIDGTFSKTGYYDGVLLQVNVKQGFGDISMK